MPTMTTTLPEVADLHWGAAAESRDIDWQEAAGEDFDGYRYAETFEVEHEGETYTLVSEDSGSSVTHLVANGTAYHVHDDEDEITAPPDEDGLGIDLTVLDYLREGIDPHSWGVEGPMMNYWYPVRGLDFDAETAAKIANYPLCVVEVDDEVGLALTGGGMDLSWEIAEACVALGYFPPAFVDSLPGMSGYRGENRVRVVEACIERDRREADSLLARRERFEALIPRLRSEEGL